MLMTGTLLMINLVMGCILYLLAWVLKGRYSMELSKSSPFECGFDPKDSARIPFSMRFFLLSVLFLIFDVEVVLLFPTVLMLANSSLWSGFMCVMGFLLILLGGLFHEWNEGSLSWVS